MRGPALPRLGKSAKLAGLDQGKRSDVVYGGLHVARDDRGKRRPAALEGHVDNIHVGGAQEQLHGKMRCAADTGGRIIVFARRAAPRLDEAVQIICWKRWVDNKNIRQSA